MSSNSILAYGSAVMVLFINVNVGQRVEVMLRGRICTGSVKYKGCLVTKKGDWVGVALDAPVGNHNGLYKGRRYFQCDEGHGIFINSSCLRFIPLRRCLFNKYRTVARSSRVEEPLFGLTTVSRAREADSLSSDETSDASYEDYSTKLHSPKYFPLKHTVSRTIPPANSHRRPQTAMSTYRYSARPGYDNSPYYDRDAFISTPTIPSAHMPHQALKRQVRRGWDDAHYTREMSVNTGRDSLKFSQWNDISM